MLRGCDIKKYEYRIADKWLINTHNGLKSKKINPVNINDFPAIKKHLNSYGVKLCNRDDQGITPYNLRNCAYLQDFSKPKIVWGNLCLKAQYAFVEDEIFINAPATMIVPADKYILAVLNSKISDYFIKQLGVTRNGGYFEYKPMFVERIPVPYLSEKERTPFIELVNKIEEAKRKDLPTDFLEQQIDMMLYNLYELTEEEISYIENYNIN